MAAPSLTAQRDPRNVVVGVPQTKCSGVIALRTFAEERFRALWSTRISDLPDGAQALLGQRLAGSMWCPLDAYIELLEGVFALDPRGPEACARDFGFYEVDRDLKHGIYRSLVSVASPSFMLRIVSKLWSMYNRSGKIGVIESQKTTARIELVGFGASSRLFWVNFLAFAEAAAQLTSVQDIRMDVIGGGGQGDHFIDFRVHWEL